jgi:hypothetical protein
MKSGDGMRSLKRVDQIGRHDEVPEAETGKQTLAERSRVDHAILLIETLESGKRTTGVAKLRVVIVLEHPSDHLRRERE